MAIGKIRTLAAGLALGVICHNRCAEQYVLELQACPNDNRSACMSSAAIQLDMCYEACSQNLELGDDLKLEDPLESR